ncbi:MAG TPA: efflux RND transporter periplasmic adaptor subunit [Pyrinomonadaceae bacterium]|nr:efflux RND transporter periplasmic adaptor subunit [Pyrinomonadaceae bacterium]
MAMSHYRNFAIGLLAVTAICSGCKRSNPTSVTANVQTAQTSAADKTIETEIVATAPFAGMVAATGKVLVPEDRTAVIGPVNQGRIVKLYAGQGTRVRRGQRLAELESADIDQAEADYLKASADAENAKRSAAAEIKLAQQTYDRTKALYEKTVVPGKNMQSAEHDLEVAKANAENSLASTRVALTAARRHLLILGMTDSAIDALGKKPGLAATFALNSPIDGVVVERNATIGATVGTDASVFKIIDISRVWIDANVFEKDLQRVRVGQSVKVTTTAFPGTTFAGRVIFVNSVVDPDSRTVKVRTEVPNPDSRLKPDMFANVEIITDVASNAISVPQSAVLEDGGKSFVFVFVPEDKTYKKLQVQTGIKTGDRVEIVDGLKAGDRVVIKGNYLLLQQSKPE